MRPRSSGQSSGQTKGSVFEALYRRLVPRLGHHKTIWAIANRICRLTWKILHQGVAYEERGSRPNPKAVRQRATKLMKALRNLGHNVPITPAQTEISV